MPIVLAVIAILPAAVLLLGALSGRIRLTSCCSVADPSKDLRIRAAFDLPTAPQDGQSAVDR